jgi:hypothetical protein
MILLKDERELNERTLERWNKALREIAERAWGTQKERGEKLDVTPIHHRIAPEGMLHEVKKRALRIESFFDDHQWHTNRALLVKLIDECVDIANFATFLGAFATLLQEETVDAIMAEAHQSKTPAARGYVEGGNK